MDNFSIGVGAAVAVLIVMVGRYFSKPNRTGDGTAEGGLAKCKRCHHIGLLNCFTNPRTRKEIMVCGHCGSEEWTRIR